MINDTILTTQNKILVILQTIKEIQDKAETIQHIEIQENYTKQYMNHTHTQLIPGIKNTLFQMNQMALKPLKHILEKKQEIPNHTNKSKIETTQHVEIQKNYTKHFIDHMKPQISPHTKTTLLEINQLINNPRIKHILQTMQEFPDGTQKTHFIQHKLLNTIYEYILSVYEITHRLLKHSPPLSTITPPAKKKTKHFPT